MTKFYAGERIHTEEELESLPSGSVVTTPFPDMEGNVAERTSDGYWILTGEEPLFSTHELFEAKDADHFTVLRPGYGDGQD